ncbi:MAG: Trk family potassium uptake protein [Clostridia bacterium]|nr:Trk family potassium uptake protein [Clostridia bacterium]
MMKGKTKIKLTVWQFLSLGFLTAIILGSLLLMLPFATKSGNSTSYINALFTATSAICVTGLAPYDTATHWTLFGQLVILLLIQTGGLGFMTLVSSIFLIFKRGMGLYSKNAFMQDAGSGKLNGITKMVKRIVIGTAIFETLGALILMIRFIPDFGAGNGIYFSIWHSISAFCNAGFDLMGTPGGEFVSLSKYASDPLVCLTLCALILIGGMGFCVWSDIIDCKGNMKKFQLNTKVVLLVNSVILVFGTVLFMVFERNSSAYAPFNFGERLIVSIFNATTTRTAGFSTVNLAELSESGYLLMVIYMFVGGNSGSTAGGIKVNTFTVIIMGMLAVFRGRKDINIGKKRIDNSLLSQALAIFAAALMLVMMSTIIICALEPQTTFKAVLFECVSALSTTGLSLSLTPLLSIGSKIILIILMFAGRVGILTLALALGAKRTAAEIRRPVDSLYIG